MSSENEESAFASGRRSVYREMLQKSLQELGYDDSVNIVVARLIKEREDALNALRLLCADFGDNDWSEDLYLPDIIDKHLGKHLHANFEPLNDDEE